MYYIAYGSNLNKYQMTFRCRTAKMVGTAVIKGYELKYKGSYSGSYLTIEKKDNGIVPVGIWEITDKDLEALDRYEGYPRFYYRREMKLKVTHFKTGEQEYITGIVYIMHEDRMEAIPSLMYIETCERGYKDFGLDVKYLDDALERTFKTVEARQVLKKKDDVFEFRYTPVQRESTKKTPKKKKKSKKPIRVSTYTERWLEVPHVGW